MLRRDIRHSYLQPRMMGFKGINDHGGDPAQTASLGGQDATFASQAAGDTLLTFLRDFRRGSVVLASPGTDVADGGYAHANPSDVNSDEARILTADDGGTDVVGSFHALVFGHDSDVNLNLGKKVAKVRTSRKGAELLAFSFNDAGFTALYGGGSLGTLTNNGTGDNTIVLNRGFASTDVVVVATPKTLGGSCIIETATDDRFRVKCFNAAGAANNTGANVFVLGYNRLSEHGALRAPLQTRQLKPRLLLFKVTGSGTAAINYGDEDAALTDNGTGNYTLTFVNSFLRAPIVLATAASARAAVTAQSTTACTVKTSNAAGAAADAVFYVAVLGFDYSVQQ